MKIVVSVFTFILMSLGVSAQNIEKLISDYSTLPNIVDISFPELSPSMIQMDADDGESAKVITKVKSMRILALSECSQEDKEKFSNTISKIEFGDYELLLKTKDDEDDVLILSKSEDKKILEFVIISDSRKDPAIIQLKGEFSRNDLSDINQEFGNKKKPNI